MATIKEDVMPAWVFPGIVNRMLNKRGLVNPEKERKILEIAFTYN